MVKHSDQALWRLALKPSEAAVLEAIEAQLRRTIELRKNLNRSKHAIIKRSFRRAKRDGIENAGS